MNLDDAIIANIDKNPFPTSAITKRGTALRVFIGRHGEMEEIGKVFKKISDAEGLFKMIILEGESGVGKSTLFKRIFDFIQGNDFADLKISNFKINIAWIEAPQNPADFTFKYIYMQVIQGFSQPIAELGGDIIKRLIKHLFIDKMNYNFNPEEKKFVENCYSAFFNRKLDIYNFFMQDFDVNNSEAAYYHIFLKIINRYKRPLSRYLKNHQIDFKFLYKFIETVNPDEEKAFKAKDDIEAETIHDKDFLKSEEDFKIGFRNIINIYKWTYDEKNVAIIIGIDSFETYPYEGYNPIFSFFLTLRNSDLKNFILFCIGTDQFWKDFRKFLEERKSGDIQFRDMIGLDLKLTNLTLDDTIEIIGKYMQKYYEEIGQNSGSNPIYPFDIEAINYLYNNSGGNIRTVLIKLRDIWEQYVSTKQVPKIQGYFQGMKNFRAEEKIELALAEIDILYNYFSDISNFSTYGSRSAAVEQGLVDILNFFKDRYPQIAEVFNKSKEITVLGEKLRPDVYFILFGALGEKEQRRIEIQVKMYEPTSSVKAAEARTSIKLLQNYETDYLYFLTTSPLDDPLRELLRGFGQRIGGINPLKKTQIAYLTLLIPTYFDAIFKRIPTLEDYQFIFNKIFTFPFEFFIEYMRFIPRNKDTSTLNLTLSDADMRKFGEILQVPVISPLSMTEPPILEAEPVPCKFPEKTIEPPQPISIPCVDLSDTPSTISEKKSGESKDVESLIPKDKHDIILQIFIKMHDRQPARYRDRATLSWLKKELANDFSQDSISNAWKWLLKSNVIKTQETSIFINEKSELILKKYGKF